MHAGTNGTIYHQRVTPARSEATRRLVSVTTGIDFNMSTNLKIKQQHSCIQFKLCADKMIQDVNSAFSPDQSVFSF